MASTHRAPKQWSLSKTETVNSFENWKQNLIYTLSLDNNFASLLEHGKKWGKKTKTAPHRDFTDDPNTVAEGARRTKQQKSAMLDLMLGQIANYCPVISRNVIVKNSTSLDEIWQTIRLHYGFQSSGSHFLDFDEIKLRPDERPEDLYQRILAFIDDNLLKQGGGITHHGVNIDDDEEMTPTIENLVVLTWLRLVHPDLPRLVKQRYGTELRSRTLASVKPEISQALPSLLEEIRTSEDAKAFRSFAFPPSSDSPRNANLRSSRKPSSRFDSRKGTKPSCPLCKEANRAYGHFLSECRYLPEGDRRYLAKARQIVGIVDDDPPSESDDEADSTTNTASFVTSKVTVRQSPHLDVFCGHEHVCLTIDTGATGNMIRASTVHRLHGKIDPTSQSAHQADGSSPLRVIGETRFRFTRDSTTFMFEGLVVEDLDVDVLAGIPFMEVNDVSVRPSKREIIISDNIVYTYGSVPPQKKSNGHAHVLRAVATETVWPGQYIELGIPEEVSAQDSWLALEPHTSQKGHENYQALIKPALVHSVGRKIRVPNLTSEPILVKKNDHFCQVRTVYSPNTTGHSETLPPNPTVAKPSVPYSSLVCLDPDSILPSDTRDEIHQALLRYDNVFSPSLEGYNGHAGSFEAHVNMGPVQPPQRKGRLPQYSRNQLELLQSKFNELEAMGVFKRPEDIGVQVEYLNPSFLVKKGSGDFRLVTAFSEVARYSKPQPSLMPSVDSILRKIGQWTYIAKTDLTKAFYQIPLSRDSMKYCGVVTPFRGIRVYTRTAMGMPGSETALEELTCRVLGDLLEEGVVIKLADDLYCGGNTPRELASNFSRLLATLDSCNLKLSPSKTVIAPSSTSILGWTWQQGTLRASAHRVATLSSCEPPTKVKGLRSFIGAFKVLARVVPGCSALLAPLDDAIAGRDSKDSVPWNDDLMHAFQFAQKSLTNNKTIHLPRPDDTLWIVTDGAVRKPGIGATLYISRGDKLLLSGFFSAKLRKHQVSWLPCEIEALSIAVAIRHFSPYIIQSSNRCCVLTDSRPCVMAFEKLCRGEFSASPRVSTFLSSVSRYQLSVRHVAGAAILPSDFASRNAPDCDEPTCQVCSFVSESMDSVVRSTSVNDILSGVSKLPFTSRAAWLSIQPECGDLRRVRAHLMQGTRPSRKATDVRDVKRYLCVATIASDGLLVVKRNEPFVSSRELIVVPRQVLHGILTSIHIKLSHPSAHQLKTVVKRYFFALDMDRAIDSITSGCTQCSSLRKTQHFVIEQTTSEPPDAVGITFAADVMKREKQLILVVRECVTSYTAACIIEDERADTLRSSLVQLCIAMRPLDGPRAIIRTDPAPGFQALVNDDLLASSRLCIEIGRVKNVNKNPVAERTVQELREHILRLDPTARAITPVSLALAVASVNSTLRQSGLSAREMLMQRDQFTNVQLPLSDREVIAKKHSLRSANHASSEKSKAPNAKYPVEDSISIGDLVYLNTDRNKSRARDRYIVVSTEPTWCMIKKFAGNQLRQASYKVKKSECYLVPSQAFDRTGSESDCASDDDVDYLPNAHQMPGPPELPDIPLEIMAPPNAPNSYSGSDSAQQSSDDAVIAKTPSVSPEGPVRIQPTRERRLPAKYRDFVM